MRDRDVFVSHSTKDSTIAEELCARLERDGISVWIAPRDVRPGRKYGEEILDAIEGTRATILLLSDDSNASVHVHHEVERAVSKGKTVFPVRVANVPPARALELFVASSQWIDLWGPGRAAGVDRLIHALQQHLGEPAGERPRREVTAPPPTAHDTRPHYGLGRSVRWMTVAAIALAVVVGAGVVWKTGILGGAPSMALQVEGPAEADVHLDGHLAGVARAGKVRQFPAAPGIHRLHVEAPGYWPYDKSVEISAASEPLTLRLAKKSRLLVTVETPGANVSVDGKRVDRPFPLDLPDGQHTIEVAAVGYDPFRKTVVLADGTQETLNIVLNKRAAQDRSVQPRGAGDPVSAQPPQPSGGDAFMRGFGEAVGRGVVGGRPPTPPFSVPRR